MDKLPTSSRTGPPQSLRLANRSGLNLFTQHRTTTRRSGIRPISIAPPPEPARASPSQPEPTGADPLSPTAPLGHSGILVDSKNAFFLSQPRGLSACCHCFVSHRSLPPNQRWQGYCTRSCLEKIEAAHSVWRGCYSSDAPCLVAERPLRGAPRFPSLARRKLPCVEVLMMPSSYCLCFRPTALICRSSSAQCTVKATGLEIRPFARFPVADIHQAKQTQPVSW